MNWKYGLDKQEKVIGTVNYWDQEKEHGLINCENFRDNIIIRETEVLFPCGPYNLPIDGISKGVKEGSLIDCLVIECTEGLLGLSGRNIGSLSDYVPPENNNTSMLDEINIPRFIGKVTHFNFEEKYGFIESDQVVGQLFFNPREVIIPYEETSNPHKAANYPIRKKDIVTFGVIETHRALRALAIRIHKRGG